MSERRVPTVVFLLAALTMGGAEAQLASVLEADPEQLRRHRSKVLIITGARHPLIDARLQALAVPVVVIDRMAMSFPAFLWSLWSYFRRERPDAVHTFLAGSTGTWGRFAAILAGVRVVIHSDLSLDPHVSARQRALDRFLNRRTTRFLPNARAIAERLQREGAPPDRIHLLRNGVDLRRLDPTSGVHMREGWGVPRGAKVIGFLGMFRPEKRPGLFLDAILAIPGERRPDVAVMAGDGPLMDDIRQRVEGHEWLKEHVRLLGVIADVPAYLASLDVLVLCSDTEGLPNVILEAMAMRIPCVATAVSDVPELLEGVGRVVPKGDAGALARAVVETMALDDDERSARLTAGRNRVEQEYSLDVAAQRFWAAHDDVLGGLV